MISVHTETPKAYKMGALPIGTAFKLAGNNSDAVFIKIEALRIGFLTEQQINAVLIGCNQVACVYLDPETYVVVVDLDIQCRYIDWDILQGSVV